MIELKRIQEKLIESLKQSGMTQSELGRKIGVGQSSIAHYIKGDILPALDTFANICQLLDLDPGEILCIKD